ncbi:hypothetical protein D3C71_1642140 [compost metagenome]
MVKRTSYDQHLAREAAERRNARYCEREHQEHPADQGVTAEHASHIPQLLAPCQHNDDAAQHVHQPLGQHIMHQIEHRPVKRIGSRRREPQGDKANADDDIVVQDAGDVGIGYRPDAP